jgi:SRSO17 transposase
MVVRYQERFQEMMAQAEVSPDSMRGLLDRLATFVQPFCEPLDSTEQRRAAEYITGLLSGLEHKTAEGIAYLLDQDRQKLQKFIGQSDWDHRPPLAILAERVGRRLGAADGVIVFDPSAFAKKGDKSVGVARQWCGRLGKVENCQVGVYMGYVSSVEHALVNFRLYLPEEWAKDRGRRKEAGVPKEIRFQTRHELALEMLAESGRYLPHAWVTGDDEMGRPAHFRRELTALGERYLLAVPSNTLIRDQEVAPPEYSGKGRHPKHPFLRVDDWAAQQPEGSWTKIEVRDGEKGPLEVEAVKCRVRARIETGGEGADELLFITRIIQANQTYKFDYYLANAAAATTLSELARVAQAEHRIEECFERGKGEAGLGDYQVRNWPGWHRHQTLSLLAAWFLTEETRRGKNRDPRADVAAVEAADRGSDRLLPRRQRVRQAMPTQHSLAAPQRAGEVLFPSFTQHHAEVEERTEALGIQ